MVNSFSDLSISNGAATNITATNAWLVGNLTGTNSTNAVLTVFYGSGNGGTNPIYWQYSNVYGAAATTGLVSILSTNLTPATWYYYRWKAVEGTNTAWASAATNFSTLATLPTNFPAATGGVFQVIGTNGAWLAPAASNVIAANGLAVTGDTALVQSNLDLHTNATGTNVHGLGSAATNPASAFDSAGSAAAVGTNLTAHTTNTANPHGVTAAQIGAISNGVMTGAGSVSASNNLLYINVPADTVYGGDGSTIRKSGNTFSVAPWIPNNLLALRYEVWNLAASYSQGLIDGPGYWFDDEGGIMAGMSTNQIWANPGYRNYGSTNIFVSKETNGLPDANSYGWASLFIMQNSLWLMQNNSKNYASSTNIYKWNGTLWEAVAGTPTATLYQNPVTVVGNRAYVWNTDSPQVTNCYFFDGTNCTEIPGLTTVEYYYSSAATLNGIAYRIGGSCSNVWGFDGSNWTEMASLPAATTHAGAVTMAGNIYIIGGASGSNFYRFDGATWTDLTLTAPYPGGGAAVSACSDGHFIYALDNDQTNVFIYAGDRWQEIPGIPAANGPLGMAVWDNSVWFVAGTGKTNVFSMPVASLISSNITLVCTSSVLPFLPAYGYASALLNVGVESVTTNNVKLYMSRDYGTNWSEAALTISDTWASSNKLFAGTVALTNQPACSNALIKVTCDSNKTVTVLGVAGPCAAE